MRDELRRRKTLPNCQCSKRGCQSHDRQSLSFDSTERRKEPIVSAGRITDYRLLGRAEKFRTGMN